VKAVAIAALTYWRVFPIQRWLGVSVLVLLAASLVGGLFARPALQAFAVLAFVVGACLMIAVLGALGLLFRQFSSASVHRLLPHLRARMLIAALAVIAVFPVLGYVLLSFAPRQPPAAAWFVIFTGIVSAWVWFTFFLPASLWVAAIVVPSAILFLRYVEPDASYLPLSAVTLVAAWIAFIAWYLRARTIRPMPPFHEWLLLRPVRTLAKLDGQLSDRSGRFAPAAAVEAWFTSRYPLRTTHRLGYGGMLLLILSVAWGFPLAGGGLDRPDALIAVACTTLFALMIAIGHVVARRGRNLWLHAHRSRRELFTAAERVLWRGALLYYLTGFAGFAVYARLVFDVSLLWQNLPSAVATGILAAYLGLACVRRVVLSMWLSTVVVFSCAGAALYALLTGHGAAFAGIVAFEIATALAARALAIRLWERIDWLALKPARTTSVREWHT
jgi:hypothetical protein